MLETEIEVELQCNKIYLVLLLYVLDIFLVCALLEFTLIPLLKVFEELNIR